MKYEKKILDILKNTLGNRRCGLHEPIFAGNEKDYLNDCINSTFVSSVGKYVDKFEKELAIYTGAKRAIAVSNGTSALQISLKLAGVDEGDEVLVPSLTFVGTVNAILYSGAIPHFIDSEKETLGADPKSLISWLKKSTEQTSQGCINRKTRRRIKGLVPVHIFGHPCKLDDLLSIANDHNLAVVEDAAEGLGSFYYGKHVGTFGKLGILSFNGNKIITTGGGGAILTNDDVLADQAKHLTTTAKVPHKWKYVHDRVGYNFRMPNLNAALGLAQLEQLDTFILSKRKLYEVYEKEFKKVKDIKLIKEPKGCKSNYWLQTILLNQSIFDKQDIILESINNHNFMVRPSWTLIHKLLPYKKFPRAPIKTSLFLEKGIINLPSSAGLI